MADEVVAEPVAPAEAPEAAEPAEEAADAPAAEPVEVPIEVSMSDVVGWYDFQWAKGSFPVCFRPGGNFFSPKFQASSKWSLNGDKVHVNWDRFGRYDLVFDPATKSMDGHGIPKTDSETNWRKAVFTRDLSPVEAILFGDGAGSEWELEHAGGKFKIEFKCDGYNHFTCKDFPAHSHWTMGEDGTSITINWGQYGTYTMLVDAASGEMAGGVAGQEDKWATDDSLWRKAKFVRNLMGAFHCAHH